MAVLWLRFLHEVNDKTRKVAADLQENGEILEALDLCEEGAFTPQELEAYEQYWDSIRTLNSWSESVSVAETKGLEKGREEGREEGRVEGREEGRAEELEKIVLTAYQNKFSVEQIRAFSNLNQDNILEILKRNKLL